MKRKFITKKGSCLVLSILSFFACEKALAQQTPGGTNKKTILNGKLPVRFASQLGINAGRIDNNTAFWVQPSIGLLFAEKFYVGVASDFCINERFLKDASYKPVKDESFHWKVNYTGLKLEYTFKPGSAVSPGVGFYSGFGKAERNFIWNSLTKQSPEWSLLDKNLCRKGYFFFAEPSALLNFNLSQLISLKANIGYRLVNFDNATSAMQMANKKFTGLSGGVTVLFSNIFNTPK
jgi:hypothetical protein